MNSHSVSQDIWSVQHHQRVWHILYHHRSSVKSWRHISSSTITHSQDGTHPFRWYPVILPFFCLCWAIRLNNQFRVMIRHCRRMLMDLIKSYNQDHRCSSPEELAARQTELLERCHVVTALLPSFRSWPEAQPCHHVPAVGLVLLPHRIARVLLDDKSLIHS